MTAAAMSQHAEAADLFAGWCRTNNLECCRETTASGLFEIVYVWPCVSMQTIRALNNLRFEYDELNIVLEPGIMKETQSIAVRFSRYVE